MDKEVKVLATLNLSEEQRVQINEVSNKVKLTVAPAKHADEILKERWAETEVLYTQGVMPEPEMAPNLRWIQFRSAGVDSFTNHRLIREKAVVATTMSGVIFSQIAEYVLMAMLAFGQKLPKIMHYQKNKVWPEHSQKWKEFLPVELRYSTVGILGYGSIGRQVARLLQPFNATVLAAKRDVMHPEDRGYVRTGTGDPHGEFFDRLYPIEAMHSLIKESDFVVLTLPLTDETRHIFDVQAFEAMKPSAFLVNVGRGGLIDQSALVHALKTGQLAGAALDVFEEEPLPVDSPLWSSENVIISPHISGLSHTLEQDALSLFIENLNRYLAELPLYNQIDPDLGY